MIVTSNQTFNMGHRSNISYIANVLNVVGLVVVILYTQSDLFRTPCWRSSMIVISTIILEIIGVEMGTTPIMTEALF